MTPNGWVVAAVADGVSASPLAEEGARIAVQSCLEYFSEFRYSPFLSAEGIQDILCDAYNYALRRILESDAEGERIPYSKFTTLHLLLYGEKIGLHWGQAGDGAVFLMDRLGRWMRLNPPMKHEEGDGPVTLQDGPDAWRFGSVDAAGELEAILMTTDGLAEALEEAPAETGVKGDMLGMLAETADGDRADEALEALLFGDDARITEAREAMDRLRSVTDDITVLLIRELKPSDQLSNAVKPVEAEADDEADAETPSLKDALRKAGDALKPLLQKGKPKQVLDSLVSRLTHRS